MDFDFDNGYWHDSLLKSIHIDRSNPGYIDTIEMVIDWYDEPASKLVFNKVRLFKAAMNFGIIASESILTAHITPPDDPDLISVYTKNKYLSDDIRLNCYFIETNSTAGIIKIVAESVEKIPL